MSSAALRDTLLALVRASPGCTRADLCRATGEAWSTVAHHLRGMEARGEVVVRLRGRIRCYALPADAEVSRSEPRPDVPGTGARQP